MILLRLKTFLKSIILPPTGPLLLAIFGACMIGRRPRLARACLAPAIVAIDTDCITQFTLSILCG